MWRLLRITPAIAALLFTAGAAQGLVLDWSAVTWNPQSIAPNVLQNHYDVDGTPGTDLTVRLAYSTQAAGSPYRAGLPAIDASLEGGRGAGARALHLGVDFTAQSHFITITVDFSNYAQGVEGVSFSLFDIDRADGSALYIDQIRSISAIGLDGLPIAAPPTFSGLGSRVSESGSILTGTGPANDTGLGSDAGNATISFNGPIRSFTFVWGVPNSNANNPIPMDISIGNINFTPVPEINPAWTAALSTFLAVGVMLRHRSSVLKKTARRADVDSTELRDAAESKPRHDVC